MADREYDIVVWGASGFTGRLVAEYLTRRSKDLPNLRWAMAGRNHTKLEQIRSDLNADDIDILIADSHDTDSLTTLVQRARVIISTVGPYALYGSELVKACAAHGTDYCDLAGEVQWIREMINVADEPARESGARIVHCCGFDSVPFDMGVWVAQQNMQQAHGVFSKTVTGLMRRMKGSFSGGTFASMINMMEEASGSPSLRKALTNVGMLLPEPSRYISRPACESRVTWSVEGDTWTAPFVMTPINSRIVQRTNALLGSPWGEDFSYEEAVATGPGISGRTRAMAMLAGTGGFMLAAALKTTRKLLQRFLPEPGEGPDKLARESGYYRAEMIAHHPTKSDADIRVNVEGDMDPGYGSTSKILAECALCLALDDLKTPGGSWTPASAMGAALQTRLETHAGLRFTVKE